MYRMTKIHRLIFSHQVTRKESVDQWVGESEVEKPFHERCMLRSFFIKGDSFENF